MPVGSVVEMYLLLYGWQLYGIVWSILTATGIAYLPVVALIIDNFSEPVESQDTKSASSTSLRRMEIGLISMILVVMIVVSPYMPLQASKVSMFKNCTGTVTTMGATGTTTDAAFDQFNFDGNDSVNVPIWWYIILTVSGGINDSVMAAIPCAVDGRRAVAEAFSQKIKDPSLADMTDRFATECHAPAKAHFQGAGTALLSGTKASDLNVLTSANLQATYRTIYAKFPVQGFVFQGTNAKEASLAGANQVTQTVGYPSCYEWWNDSTYGLRTQLLDIADQDNIASLKAWGTDLASGAESKIAATFGKNVSHTTNYTNIENDTINAMIKNSSEALNQPTKVITNTESISDKIGYMISQISNQGAERLVGLVYSTIASLGSALFLQPMLFMLRDAAPYFQSITLMFIYFLLPVVLVVGKYKWQTIRTVTVVIFTIKLWSSIWVVLDALDRTLFTAIVIANDQGGTTVSLLANATAQSMTILWALNSVTLTCYIAMPLFALQMMSWAGERTAQAVSGPVGSMSTDANNTAKQGPDLVKTTAKAAIK